MKNRFDVLVVGGGLAGVAAAIAAARQGASVCIVERMNCFGGAAATCLVNPFMQFWTNKSKRVLSEGIFAEIREELKKVEGYTTQKKYLSEGALFDEEKLKFVLNQMILEAGITPLFNSFLSGIEVEGERVKSVKFANKSGEITISAEYYIDCTGDGDLSAMAGCDYQLGRPQDNLCQPMTLCFRVGGVDETLFWKDLPRLNKIYAEYREQGKIKNVRQNILAFPNINNGVIHFNSTRVIKCNPTDCFDISKAEIEAREQVYELFEFIKAHSESFKDATVISTAIQTGVRESRMIKGDYVLTVEDLLSCKKFEDGIAACNYDIDIHNPEGAGTSHHYFKDDTYYTIPYRCLCPIGKDNLLVAGRCISSDHEAQASYRIMPTVCTLGEAAGTGAYVAWKHHISVHDVNAKEVKEILRKNGAVID